MDFPPFSRFLEIPFRGSAVNVAAAPETFLRLSADLRAPGRAREEAIAACRRWGVGEEVLETARLLVSELVTNVLCAAEGGQIEVRAELRPKCVVLDVWDPGAPFVAAADVLVSMPAATEESGRGLPLLEMLSSLWYERPSADRPGKHLIAHIPQGATCGCAAEEPDGTQEGGAPT